MGIVLLSISVASVGFGKTRLLYLRRWELQSMLRFIQIYSGKIRLGRQAPGVIAREMSLQQVLSNWLFLDCLCRYIEAGEDFPCAFSVAVSQNKGGKAASPEDWEEFEEFGVSLGEGDTQEELRRCGYFEEIFSRRVQMADQEIKEKAPLYQTVWCCLGALAGLLFL